MAVVYDEEHPPVARKVICVDFDATLFPWGELNSDEPPFKDAVDTVKAFKRAGYTIIILTSRMSRTWWKAEGWREDEAWLHWYYETARRLNKHDIPWDDITAEKVPAEYYIDDKAIEFKGDWEAIRKRVLG